MTLRHLLSVQALIGISMYRERMLQWTPATIQCEYRIPTIIRLTSLYAGEDGVDRAPETFRAADVSPIVALRGDSLARMTPSSQDAQPWNRATDHGPVQRVHWIYGSFICSSHHHPGSYSLRPAGSGCGDGESGLAA